MEKKASFKPVANSRGNTGTGFRFAGIATDIHYRSSGTFDCLWLASGKFSLNIATGHCVEIGSGYSFSELFDMFLLNVERKRGNVSPVVLKFWLLLCRCIMEVSCLDVFSGAPRSWKRSTSTMFSWTSWR